MNYKIADLVIQFDSKYDMLRNRSRKYLLLNSEEVDYTLFVNEEHIQKELLMSHHDDKELAEYIVMGTTFYKVLLQKNGCLLHASSVVIDNEAYLFSAPCGTGKSTHTSLWLQYLADKSPYILNDDKPAIRLMEDGIYAYGTPFSGKHDMSENKKVKLKAICFLERSKINFIRKVEPKEAVKLFYEQTIRHLNEEEVSKFFDILEVILKEIPIYKLHCDMSEEAVKLSYNTMKGEPTNEN